jgi:hypothetical protein
MYVLARSLFLSSVFTLAACGAVDTGDAFDEPATSDNGQLHGAAEPHMFVAKGDPAGKPSRPGGGGSPLLYLHGGNVLVSPTIYSIWWGSQWNNATFAGDKITGMTAFFNGYSGTNFSATTAEYEGNDGRFVSGQATFMGNTTDTSAPPSRALSTTGAVAEACKIANNNPDPNAVYFIFTATGAGHVSYCAWHSWGNCSNGAPIQVAYMPNIDGIAGCDPVDRTTSHSQGLAALANVTSHELSEAITDPRGTGWVDQNGQEDGDKCAWTFSAPVTLSNGSQWVLQQEWSNAAYTAGTGTPRGCIQGN